MPRPSFEPTEKQQTKVETMAACGERHEAIAAELEIAPKTLRKHFRNELRRGAIRAHVRIRKTLFGLAISGRNVRATTHADRRWDAICERQSAPQSQSMPAPQIIIRTDGEHIQKAEGGEDR